LPRGFALAMTLRAAVRRYRAASRRANSRRWFTYVRPDCRANSVWNLDIDRQPGDVRATIDRNLNCVRVDVSAGERDDVIAQQRHQICVGDRAALMDKQDVQPPTRDRGGTVWPKRAEQIHAALLPKGVPRR
jgi:hypothetical protein